MCMCILFIYGSVWHSIYFLSVHPLPYNVAKIYLQLIYAMLCDIPWHCGMLWCSLSAIVYHCHVVVITLSLSLHVSIYVSYCIATISAAVTCYGLSDCNNLKGWYDSVVGVYLYIFISYIYLVAWLSYNYQLCLYNIHSCWCSVLIWSAGVVISLRCVECVHVTVCECMVYL